MATEPAAQTIFHPYYEETVTESTIHYKAIKYIEDVLEDRYRLRADVFVGASNFVYWEEGNIDKKLSPDVYICFGARNIERKSYKIWEDGVVPQVVFEVSSDSSRITDLGTKKAIYEMLGVEEYYIFDPFKEYLKDGFKAFRLRGDNLQSVATTRRVFSRRLGLDLRNEGSLLRFYEHGSNIKIQTSQEARQGLLESEAARAQAEAAQAQAEAAQAQAERRAEELQRQLDDLRSQR